MKHTIYNSDASLQFDWFKEHPEDFLEYEKDLSDDDFTYIAALQSISESEMWRAAHRYVRMCYHDECVNLSYGGKGTFVACLDFTSPSYELVGYNLSNVLEHCAEQIKNCRSEATFELYDEGGEVFGHYYGLGIHYRMLTPEGEELWDTEDFDWDKHTSPIGSIFQKVYGY